MSFGTVRQMVWVDGAGGGGEVMLRRRGVAGGLGDVESEVEDATGDD